MNLSDFFTVADLKTSVMWISIFIIVFVVLWFLHRKEKRKYEKT